MQAHNSKACKAGEICTKAAAMAFLKKRKKNPQMSRMFVSKGINCEKQDSPESVRKGG